MKTIYALLVGINEYNDPRNNLKGCVRDVDAILDYFRTHFNNKNQRFLPQVLTDQEATRTNIIAGFEHFNNAKDGDICLFHYSGHGSQCPSPEEFSHLDVNGKHQTLVCHDSRIPGGRDLLDKELSYLIWKSTKDKDIQFVAMMDCCHSGSNTRNDYVRTRRFSSAAKISNPIKDYFGFEYYSQNKAGQYTPPVGHHILLSAAHAKETAKEVFSNGKPGGIFTFCLLDLLKEVNNQISYSELINRIRIRIKNKVREQSPQLEVTRPLYENLAFLSDTPKLDFSYILSYEKTKQNWVVDTGALHGILPSKEDANTVFQLENGEDTVAVKNVLAHYSTVTNLDVLNKNKTYRAKLKNTPIPSKSMRIAFDSGNDPLGEKIMRAALIENDSNFFTVSTNPKNSHYLIHAKQDHYFLTKLDESVTPENFIENNSIHKINSPFKKIKNYHPDNALEFILCLEKMAKWIHVLELIHPNTSIKSSELKIKLSTTLDYPANQDAISFCESDHQVDNILSYEKYEDQWCRPAFKLNIENTGKRTLWVSLLYLSNDFGINNILISKQELLPLQNVSASYVSNGTTKFIIPVQLEDHYLKSGIHSVQEYLKIFICTDEFETGPFNQEGVPFDERTDPTTLNQRGLFLETVVQPDWTTIEIPLVIHRALESLGKLK